MTFRQSTLEWSRLEVMSLIWCHWAHPFICAVAMVMICPN
jgi:hypothetical protein